jgi:hypothetical protein
MPWCVDAASENQPNSNSHQEVNASCTGRQIDSSWRKISVARDRRTRNPQLQEQGFQKAYDAVVRTFVDRIATSSDLEAVEGWDPEQTVVLVRELSNDFRRYFDEEIPGYHKAIQERRVHDAVKAGAETVKSIGGLLPGLGQLISIVDLGTSVTSAAWAAFDARRFMDHMAADAAARRERDGKIEEALMDLKPSNGAKILTVSCAPSRRNYNARTNEPPSSALC